MNSRTFYPVPSFEDKYRVDDLGNIHSILSGKILKPIKRKDGYYSVNLYKEPGKSTKKLVHRIICLSIYGLPPKDKPQINHKDGNKGNNLPGNLEWVSLSENMVHALNIGLIDPKNLSRPNNKFNSKLTPELIDNIKREIELGNTNVSLAKKYNISKTQVSRIKRGKSWA